MSLRAKPLSNLLRANSIIGPAAILFLSANIANAANLLFNMIFARLMGPAIFADLTLLLTLKLGVLSFLGALQFAFSEQTSQTRHKAASKINAFNLSWRSLKISVPVMFVVIASANGISSWLNFSSPHALIVLALTIPFFLPMVIYRGLTQGLIDIPKIVLSIQSEWAIRLIGSLLLWKMGFGLTGIAMAVGLSIIAGFLVSTDKQDWAYRRNASNQKRTSEAKDLAIIALPYLILQLAQVLVLDSDILIAKAALSADTAGLVAGLLLIQRVFFFAFLSCSMILQPYVAKHRGQDKSPKELFVLLAGIAFISMTILSVIVPNASLIVKIMLGEAYTELSSIVWISALTGAVFICSHLCAVYEIAKGRKRAAIIILGFGIFQLAALGASNHVFMGLGLHKYFMMKLGIQTLCAFCMLGTIIWSQKPSRGRA